MTCRGNERTAPVLLDEVLTWLAPRPGGRYCDGTVGLGGHARAVLERSAPDGKLIGIDRDPDALEPSRLALEPFGDRVTLVHARFSRGAGGARSAGSGRRRWLSGRPGRLLAAARPPRARLLVPKRRTARHAHGPAERRDRGRPPAPDRRGRAGADHPQLRRGAARRSGRQRDHRGAARRDLDTTGKLAALVARAIPRHEYGKNPATRTFQALRIAVNEELVELERFLSVAADCLRPGGRLCVIAFHSLEDRIVKRRLRALAGRDGGRSPPSCAF